LDVEDADLADVTTFKAVELGSEMGESEFAGDQGGAANG
jgi:hypothetical protein